MPCYRPLKAFRSETVNPSGKRSIVFNLNQSNEERVTLACGQCMGCRLKRSREWAIRMMHEASLYEENCFLTLTYSPENLPKDGSLHVEDFQNFMKRFRKLIHPLKIRFFHCGEYGEKYGRPHYHAIIFGYDFRDKYIWRRNATDEFDVYRSATLEKLWPHGMAELGSVTFESAAYVARYITKKVTGRNAEDHYSVPDPETGELYMLEPEYTTMSRRPGIGKAWLEKYKKDVFPSDFILVKRHGKMVKCGVPKYYNAEYEKEHFSEMLDVKEEREYKSFQQASDCTPDRLAVRERIHLKKLEQLKRKFDHDT